MAKLFTDAFFTALDSNGNPISGAKWNFYRTGTSTRQDTFTDNALTTKHANPVVADSAGRFAPIYLSAIDYKAELTNAADVVIKTIDPVHGVDDESHKYLVSTFGGVADDSTDNTTAINDALDAAEAAGGGIVFFDLPGHWRYSGAIALSSSGNNITFDGVPGAVLKATSGSAEINTPDATATKTALGVNAAAGSIAVTLQPGQGSNFSVGSWIAFESQKQVYDVGGSFPSKAREVRQVIAVSGDVVTLNLPTLFDFNTADSATFEQWDTVRLEHLTIRNLGLTKASSVAKVRHIDIKKVAGVTLENIHIFDAGGGIRLTECQNVQGDNLLIERLQNYSDSFGYGLFPVGACTSVQINNLIGYDMRHVFTTLPEQRGGGGGDYSGPEFVTISNGIGYGGTNSLAIWDTHEHGRYIDFVNCQGYLGNTSAACAQVRATLVSHIGGRYRGGFRCLDYQAESQDGYVEGCELTANDIDESALKLNGTRHKVMGGKILDAGGRAIGVDSTDTQIEGVKIRNWGVNNTASAAVTLFNAAGANVSVAKLDIEYNGNNVAAISGANIGNLIQGNRCHGGFSIDTVFNGAEAGAIFRDNIVNDQPEEGGSFAITATMTLDPGTMNGSVITNEGATGEITCHIGPATKGVTRRLQRVASHRFNVSPDAGETIVSALASPAAGKDLRLDADSTRVELRCIVTGTWHAFFETGTATAEP